MVQALSADPTIYSIVTFDPSKPETNMVHGYLRGNSIEQIQQALDEVSAVTRIRVLKRIRSVPADHPVSNKYCAMFEWSIGEHNARIPEDIVLKGWKAFAARLADGERNDASSWPSVDGRV